MSALIRLTGDGPQVSALPDGAFKPAPAPRPLPNLDAINAGQGDVRAGIRPNVAWPEAATVRLWEGGVLSSLADLSADEALTALVLTAQDDPADAAQHFARLRLIAVDFARFSDGRGYSIAALLRTRYGWRGELRAVGDVLADQMFALARCGFDSFALRGDQDPAVAIKALSTFPAVYQAGADGQAGLVSEAAA
jgi:uncharacterized protein (DUF934 family)